MYVDYILGIGDCKTVENAIRNTIRLEEDTKFRFSRKKIKIFGYKKPKVKNWRDEIISERGNHREDR